MLKELIDWQTGRPVDWKNNFKYLIIDTIFSDWQTSRFAF